MQCKPFDPAWFLNGAAWEERNRITISSLYNLEVSAYDAPTWSVKYVLQGTEHYYFDRRKFSVGPGKFLLVNRQRPLDISLHSKKAVVGFCIHLEDRFMQEIYTDLVRNGEASLDRPFETLCLPQWEELLYTDSENEMGSYLRNIASRYDPAKGTVGDDRDALFHGLARRLLRLQNNVTEGSKRLDVVKSATKKELIRRLNHARELMDEGVSNDMNTIAKKAMLSGSHFFRSFKKLYGLSPYQYLLQKRIQRAAALLSQKKMNATEVAFSCGFADLASFSKAFRRFYRQSPVQFMKDHNKTQVLFQAFPPAR